MEEISISAIDNYAHKAIHMIMEFGPKVLLAVILLLVGIRLINFLSDLLDKLFERQNIDRTLRPFILNMMSWTFKAMLFISCASMVGVETTSFVAVIGAASLAVGLALQGTLANFAGGILILLFKPYKVHDIIKVEGHYGQVEEIEIFVTKILTPDNEVIIVPNGSISNGNITNYSAKGVLRINHTIRIDYKSDMKFTRKILMSLMESESGVLKDPAPLIVVKELKEDCIEIGMRCFVKAMSTGTNITIYWRRPKLPWSIMESKFLILNK